MIAKNFIFIRKKLISLLNLRVDRTIVSLRLTQNNQLKVQE